MSAVKEVQLGKPSLITSLAPPRSLVSPIAQVWTITERELDNEQTLLERVQEICREYGQGRASQVSIRHYQAVPPQAVSIIDPPERAWLVRLYLVGHEQDQLSGHREAVVVLRGSEAYMMLR